MAVREREGRKLFARTRLFVEQLEDRLALSHSVSIVDAPSGNVDEGTAVNLASSDPGAGTFTYEWTVTGPAPSATTGSDPTFSFTPNDDGIYHVTLTVTDTSDNHTSTAETDITVDNVPPQDLAIDGPTSGVRGQTLSFTGTFTDPGSADIHTFAWSVTKDGNPFDLPAGTVTDQADFSFIPTGSGDYVVSFTVTDDDTGVGGPVTQDVAVTAVALQPDPGDPSKTALVVGGTESGDVIRVIPAPLHAGVKPKGKPEFGVKVLIGGVSQGTFNPDGSIIVYGQGGNDNIQVGGSVKLRAFLFGDAGNDRLKGGAGNSVLIGGTGNDHLGGGKSGDLLIGGEDLDRLVGGPADDILIGGSTSFDTDLAALSAIMDEWASTRKYEDRIDNLSDTGSGPSDNNGFFLLSGTTVIDDGVKDVLTGAAGSDWFFAFAPDKITGKQKTEQVNNP